MRVAIVNWTTRHVGGAETYLAGVMPALASRGHEVYFWGEQEGPADRDEIAGLDRVSRGSASAAGLQPAINALSAWQPDVLFAHGMLDPVAERRVLATAPTVFFAHAYYGTCISGSKTVGLPVVQPCEREFGPACVALFYPKRCGGLNPLTMMSDYRRQSARLSTLRSCASIVTISEHMRREYLRHGFAADAVACLPPAVPSHATASTIRRGARVVESGAHRVSFVGRLDRLKGCRTLIEAVPEIRRRVSGALELTIAGDGPDLESCRSLAKTITSATADTTIRFTGWLSREACDRLLDDTDVLAMPSLWPEPFGLAGPEAIGRGVPVAAFAVGGIPEWLEDGRTGALAPGHPPTAAGLADAIARCLTSPDIQRSVQDRSAVGGADLGRHVSKLVDVLQSAARTAAHRHPASTAPASLAV